MRGRAWRAALVVMLFLPAAVPALAADGSIRAGGPVRGQLSAPVTMVEYSDFTCGYCLRFFRDTWPRLHAKYVTTGKVRFFYRDYPRANGGPGLEAAMAARCAGEQGQYWIMHDFLFARGGHVPQSEVRRQAASMSLNLPTFTTCLSDRRQAAAAYEDRAEAAALGFRGTPGFILMLTDRPDREAAVMIPGAVGFDVFEKHIERLLQAAAIR